MACWSTTGRSRVRELQKRRLRRLGLTTLSTYLLFDGKCEQAMKFYKSCLGGELTLTKVGESPAKDFMPVAMHHKVVNARLKGWNIDISASDWLMPNRIRFVATPFVFIWTAERSKN